MGLNQLVVISVQDSHPQKGMFITSGRLIIFLILMSVYVYSKASLLMNEYREQALLIKLLMTFLHLSKVVVFEPIYWKNSYK